jgi:hypothetical protein
MKKLLLSLVCVLALSSGFTAAQEALSYCGGQLVFQRPEGVTLWEERPRFNNIKEQAEFWHGKIRINVDIYDSSSLRTTPQMLMAKQVYMLAQKGDLSHADFISLFDSRTDFVFWDYTPVTDIRASYKFLELDGSKIGETYFHADSFDMEAAVAYGWTTSVIVDNKIVNIYLTIGVSKDFHSAKNMDAYFFSHDGKFYWKNTGAINTFYEDLCSDKYKNLPEQLQTLREAYETLIGTLKIKQKDGAWKNIEAKTPVIPYEKTHTATTNLHIRDGYIRDGYGSISPIRLTIPQGTDVQVLNTGRMETIDGITAPWVLVTTAKGDTGWCFSGYLQKIP